VTSFLGEYWRVAGHGIGRSLRGGVPGQDGRAVGRWSAVRGLLGESADKLTRVAARLREAALR
jgi:hypothetical protein